MCKVTSEIKQPNWALTYVSKEAHKIGYNNIDRSFGVLYLHRGVLW